MGTVQEGHALRQIFIISTFCVACDIIAEIYSFEASCPAEKPVFHFSDLGQRPKIFDQAFPPVNEQPKTNHLE